MKRRQFIAHSSKATLAMMAAGTLLESCGASKKTAGPKLYAQSPTLIQKPLPYGYKDLEPAIDAATMELHYTKHAAAYTRNMTEAIAAEKLEGLSLETLLQQISKHSVKLRNNAGGHYNHESFWQWMKPGGQAMSAAMTQLLESQFGSVSEMKNRFTDSASKRFGSGWAWLVLTADKKLAIGSTPNQDNPLMDVSELKGYPLLGLDVWEHAYYLKYQNKRADYIANWWSLVNWADVEARYHFAMSV